MFFLDANLVIYLVEQPPIWGPKAKNRIVALMAGGEQIVVTDIVRMECLVGPYGKAESDFQSFLSSPDVQIMPITAAVCERAARIRAAHGFKPLDSLHLAAAVVHDSTLFLTNDGRLSSFADITIEVLV